ncbi:hypothetical protein MLD38_024641 [Melastoma candidum]|uniref:Uncharacterized protein n=1 Tax=Melastoma candidum TaxID=119954 RepID=A0ACB9NUM1_9MYRT|nr:hypothetical protein MLD38_024641 [Melastoma candidum]
MPSPPPPTPSGFCRVPPRTWRACAGACVRIPPLRSRVFYFPQGHLEQQSFLAGSSNPPSSSSVAASHRPLRDPRLVDRAALPCVVSAVDFMADCTTDEVFVRFRLRPDAGGGGPRDGKCFGKDADYFTHEDGVFTCAKMLTPSDANNGGGFSVPRSCAEAIFPMLSFGADPPVQVLAMRDTNGVIWNFRHIYRGTPRRHLLTTGWSKFVNSKKLVAGDTVIFMREAASASKEMSVGIRRASRVGGATQCARWRRMIGGESNGSSDNEERSPYGLLGHSREEEEVDLAMEKWLAGEEFEVVYYPTRNPEGVGTAAEFVIVREAVKAATSTYWGGARVKMVLESEDCSRVTGLQGTVSTVEIPQEGIWKGSPWRMLQIVWDEPDIMKDKKYISPWQVQVVAIAAPLLPACYQPTCSFTVQPGLQTDGGVGSLYPCTGCSNMTVEHQNPSLVDNNTPLGMQGARQYNPSAFGSLSHINGNAPMQGDNVIGEVLPESGNTLTDLNMASSQSEILSPDSPTDSVQPFGVERLRRGAKAARLSDAGGGSFQLFGQIIHARHPVENVLAIATGKEGNGMKGPSGPECINPHLGLSALACFNGIKSGIAEGQMLNSVL